MIYTEQSILELVNDLLQEQNTGDINTAYQVAEPIRRVLSSYTHKSQGAEVVPSAAFTGTVSFDSGRGSLISFDSPATGSISIDYADAILSPSSVVIIRHNDAAAPTFPTDVLLEGFSYKANQDNFIVLRYVAASGSTRVIASTIGAAPRRS